MEELDGPALIAFFAFESLFIKSHDFHQVLFFLFVLRVIKISPACLKYMYIVIVVVKLGCLKKSLPCPELDHISCRRVKNKARPSQIEKKKNCWRFIATLGGRVTGVEPSSAYTMAYTMAYDDGAFGIADYRCMYGGV